MERETDKQEMCVCVKQGLGGAYRCLRRSRFHSVCWHLSRPLSLGLLLGDSAPAALPSPTPSQQQEPQVSLTDSDRLSYQNRGPGLHCDWRGRNIVGLGLENSSQKETIMRHFKKSELNATHSWQFCLWQVIIASGAKKRGAGSASLFCEDALCARVGLLTERGEWELLDLGGPQTHWICGLGSLWVAQSDSPLPYMPL